MKYEKSFYQIKSNAQIFEKIVEEKETIGYYNLPYQDTTEIKEFAKTVKQKDIVVVGIGGSSLGTYAIHQFLLERENSKKLHFLESTDPVDLHWRLKKIDLDHALFIIISKSGSTVETISILKYLHSITTIDNTNTVCVTENDSKLNAFAKANDMKTFEIAKNVGGRFSVFSPVGLLPLAIMGLDIDKILEGCKKVSESFFDKSEYYDTIMEKARFIVENKNRFNINVVFSYSSLLDGFNKWYVQLWGESLGKVNINGTKQGLTPIGIIGPVDQHSFLQLVMEGKRDKTITFIKIDDFKDDMTIPDITIPHLEELDYLNNIKFKDLINMQADSTIEAIKNLKDIPYDIITIKQQNEYNIGKLMFTYELLTSIVGSFVQINTYDQPGVEAGKIILKNKLSIKK
ncbi:putative glucose-6-phosphate isomerase [Malaciobacter pacificus]|jgi:glucose-6-phosphate isomerase|uniref:Glucose-6-phosphate isomerase n=1 Tax=Malaciobacter pacificus TaxID=1080223 RepID=A0A5C2H7N2_9BACT|nr:glucose-6-phosphate isomerase [Malaciobacter pacificus]QEP34947.1 phosphoglucose isomerase [Malaciobacter pacificus]GGD42783.1 putative glucose-6-phosphate isomerase [Malaciobacter pacificus]